LRTCASSARLGEQCRADGGAFGRVVGECRLRRLIVRSATIALERRRRAGELTLRLRHSALA
jgi:hypothetical protein